MIKEPRPHPDHEWLLLFSDGELPPEARPAMQKHLEACWECRHELQQIEEAIGAAVRYRKEALGQHLPPPPAPWRDLSSGFAQIDQELTPPSLLSRFAAALRMPRYAIPLAAAAALGAVVFVARNNVNVPTGAEPAPAVATPVQPTAVSTEQPIEPAKTVEQTPPRVAAAETPQATPAELTHSAIRVAQLLHEHGADLGEPIELSRAEGRVVVRAYGLDSERRAELEPLLKQIPFVDFQTSNGNAPAVSTTVARFAGVSGVSPFQKQLEQGLGGQAAVDTLAGESLDHAETMMLRAHALRRLAEEFSADTLSDEDQRALRTLRHNHAQALSAEVARLERTLAPALRSLGTAPALLATTTAAPNEANVFAAARRLESSIAELTGAKPVTGAADQLPSRLATDLASTGMLARSLAARD